MDIWSERAQAYRDSPAHREGPDLDLIVEWSAGATTALDVGTGGGHVARRLREAGLQVVTTDPAPGMQPDVVSRSEELPFADSSFDVVASRLAAHHFADVAAAVRRDGAGRRRTVIVVDNTFGGDALEEAERCATRPTSAAIRSSEWHELFAGAGLVVEDERSLPQRVEIEPWLARAGCEGAEAERVKQLVADRSENGWVTLDRTAFKAVKR